MSGSASSSGDRLAGLRRLVRARWERRSVPLGALATLPVLGAFWFLGGLWGTVAWAAVAVVWLAGPPVAAVAVAQFGLLALVPDGAGLAVAAPVELSLLVALVTDVVDDTRSVGAAGIGLAATVGLAGLGLAVLDAAGLLGAIAAIVLGFGGASYLCHRYLLVALDVVEPVDG